MSSLLPDKRGQNSSEELGDVCTVITLQKLRMQAPRMQSKTVVCISGYRYYVTPSGKKLRSMPEIERFLSEHPEHVCRGVKSSRFSFLIPRPLDKDYCRKKNDSLTCGEKSKSLVTDAHLNKLGLVPPSFKVVSSKPKPEKLQFRKKGGSGVSPGGESQVLCSEKRSSGIVDCQQATGSPFSSQKLAIMTVTNGATPTGEQGNQKQLC